MKMKLIALAASTLALGVFASTAFAQSCGSPTTITSGQTITNAAGLPTTCGGDQSFTDICGGATLTGASNVYSWVKGAGAPSGNIVVTPTAPSPYDTAIAIVESSSTCAAALGNCLASADNAGSGLAETVSLAGTGAAGNYFLIISSFSATGANQCGPYGVTVGTLPVKLQSFSIN
jgi:hypothetical protein